MNKAGCDKVIVNTKKKSVLREVLFITVLFLLISLVFNLRVAASNQKYVALQNESFEKGSFAETSFLAGSGQITNDPKKVINGSYSALLDAANSKGYSEFAYSDSNKIKFEKNTTYSVTFSFKSIQEPSKANNGSFYFLARSTNEIFDHKKDKGWTEWTLPTGEKGSKTVTFTTDNEQNYILIWGIYNGGALSIDDISISKLSESFEKGTFAETSFLAGSGHITNDPTKVISGSHSAFLDATNIKGHVQFSYSDSNKIKFEKNTKYEITFSYKSIVGPSLTDNGTFYFLARSSNPIYDPKKDRGWTTWEAPTGTKGIKKVQFTTGNEENYFLIWGIYNGGAFSLDNIYIKKVSESFEKGEFNATNHLAVSGEITNDPSKVIDGSYSAHLSSVNAGFSEFSYTDSSKVQFLKNTAYTVTFSYKTVKASNNGYFYFMARSTNKAEDKGVLTWQDTTGTLGTKTIKFITGDQDSYYLMWGIYNDGALSIDNITITEDQFQYDANGRLIKQVLSNHRTVKYYYDNNGNLIKSVVS
ncbi:RHS repeat protein [Paenibacillus sp. GSMTC-2017]|uniref:RHS repeat domain-containing protein n=1 Tax=Paenibacillus sp. GSMTC-2017 TaxID=2794350 RepID=UPI0018D7BC23|nr:RHS repeat domain-containing protein [Paenibacillus sp. GSMTC-2017]MBH5320949.1 RHS repeat protein [Paenibacillus sp. GSMTC-2017]